MKKILSKLGTGLLSLFVALSGMAVLPIGVSAAPQTNLPNQQILKVAALVGSTNTSTRYAGYDKYETAAKISQAGWQTSDYAILAPGMTQNLVDAVSSAPLAAYLNAPVLLTQGDSLNTFARSELVRLKVKTVYIASGSAVIKQNVLNQLAAMNLEVKPLGGLMAYDTAINFAKEMDRLGADISQIAVVTSVNNADSMSIAPIAAAQGMPIIITEPKQLPDRVKAYLDSIKSNITESYVIGGTAVVSDNVKNALPGTVSRYAGLTRYDTNEKVITNFISELNFNNIYMANGQDASMSDSVTAAPLAAKTKSPIVLLNPKTPDQTYNYLKENFHPFISALGGTAVISSDVMAKATAATNIADTGVTKGGASASSMMAYSDPVVISGDNVTLQNANLNYSLYIQGDNAKISNVKANGTVFVDPGSDGNVTLDGVEASNVVVLSGGENSVHMKNVKADTLRVQSSSNVHIVSEGTTTIKVTIINSEGILDSQSGSFGQVSITKTANGETVVELRGNFDQVVVEGQVTLKAAENAQINKVTVAPKSKGESVTLQGTFKTVEVNQETKLALGANTKVTDMVTNAKTDLNLDKTAQVTNLDDKGNDVTLSGEGQSNIGDNTTDTGSNGNPGDNSNPGDDNPPSDSYVAPAFNSFSTGVNNARLSSNEIAFQSTDGSYSNLSNAVITTNKAPLTMTVKQNGSTVLGQWTLSSTTNSDLFTVSNLSSLNVLNTFNAVHSANITAAEVFSAIDFTSILQTMQSASSADKNIFYNTILPALAGYDGNPAAEQSIITALDLPTIYIAANDGQGIKDAFTTAVTNFNTHEGTAYTAGDFVGESGSSADAWSAVNGSLSSVRNQFYNDIDFNQLVNALRGDTGVYQAINFQAVFNAIRNVDDPSGLYSVLANAYTALNSLSQQCKSNLNGAVSIVNLLSDISGLGTITINLNDGTSTTTYTVVFP